MRRLSKIMFPVLVSKDSVAFQCRSGRHRNVYAQVLSASNNTARNSGLLDIEMSPRTCRLAPGETAKQTSES